MVALDVIYETRNTVIHHILQTPRRELKMTTRLSDVRMYANDTNLTFASNDPEELFSSLTHDLSNLKQWLDSNRLSVNALKTKCLFLQAQDMKSLCSPVNLTFALMGTLKESIARNA